MKNKSVKLIEEILLYCALFFVMVRFVLERYKKDEAADIFSWIITVLAIALVVFKLMYWLFPKWFKNKPTLEEIEQNQFGDKK